MEFLRLNRKRKRFSAFGPQAATQTNKLCRFITVQETVLMLFKLKEVLNVCSEFINSKRQALFWHRSCDPGRKWQNQTRIFFHSEQSSTVVNVVKLRIQNYRPDRILQVVWTPSPEFPFSFSLFFLFLRASLLTRLGSDFRKLEEKFINGILAKFAAQRKHTIARSLAAFSLLN